jgi:hypothetical protein
MDDQASYLQYLGAGATKDCIEAIEVLLQSPMRVIDARLLTRKEKGRTVGAHGFMLKLELTGTVVIPPGFSSGYGGEGPRGLSYALALFESFGIHVGEVFIDEEMYKRLSSMQLTRADVARIEEAVPRAYDSEYLGERDYDDARHGTLWSGRVDPILPLALVAPPLADLVPRFKDNPDHALMTGYRRLEDRIRSLTSMSTSSTKLLSSAFLGDEAALEWRGLDPGEQTGRAQLFTGTYMAFRNRRAHREQDQRFADDVQEFLLLSLLFDLLEGATRKKQQRRKSTPRRPT